MVLTGMHFGIIVPIGMYCGIIVPIGMLLTSINCQTWNLSQT